MGGLSANRQAGQSRELIESLQHPPGTRSCLLGPADTSEDVISQGCGPRSENRGHANPHLHSGWGAWHVPEATENRAFSPVIGSDRFPGGGKRFDCNLYLSAESFAEASGLPTWRV